MPEQSILQEGQRGHCGLFSTFTRLFFPPATRAGSLFPARGHSLAEHLSEQGVGTPLRRSEHMQISQRDAQPEVLMNL